MDSDLKPLLLAILERLDIYEAKFDAFQREMLEFKAEMRDFRTQFNEKLDVLGNQQNYFASKLG